MVRLRHLLEIGIDFELEALRHVPIAAQPAKHHLQPAQYQQRPPPRNFHVLLLLASERVGRHAAEVVRGAHVLHHQDEEGAYVALRVVHRLLDRRCAEAQVGAKEELPHHAVARVAEAIDVAARFPEARIGNVRIEDQEEREEHAEHYEVEDADALKSVVGPHRIDHVVDLAERRGCDGLRHYAYGKHGRAFDSEETCS